MSTKSITYALKGIILLAHLAAVPVMAQTKFASQNNYAFQGRNKISVTNFYNYYTIAQLNSRNQEIGSNPFPSASPGNSNNTANENSPVNKKENAIVLPFSNQRRFNAWNVKIGFRRTTFNYPVNPGKDIGIPEYPPEQLMLYAVTLKQYAKKNGFDTTYAFFSNMGMLNSKKRFFVVNLISMKIEQSGFVAQGRGTGPSRFDKQYSNKKESKCTSLGRYKIMKKYQGEYGSAYRMMGLDSSNCNAFKRNIVLHSMGCIPDVEWSNMPVCISEGCPAVSLKFLSSLSKIIDTRKKPVLLWIFDSNLEEVVVEPRTLIQEPAYVEEKIFHSCSVHRAPTTMKEKL